MSLNEGGTEMVDGSLLREEHSLREELPTAQPLRIGIICPYSFEAPGGVQAHVKDFAEELISRGHSVSVLAPGRRTKDMPLWVQTTNTSFAFPYNGSVAHISYFGFVGNTVRNWVRQGHFDIIHVHEPEIPSISHKVFFRGFSHPPIVATFHTSFQEYPLALKLFEKYLHDYLKDIDEAVFVSPSAQKIAVHYLDRKIPVHVIPNGIHKNVFVSAQPHAVWQGSRDAPTIGFLGRMKEGRKGFSVFAQAMPAILEEFPHARFLCAGDGKDEAGQVLSALGSGGDGLREHVEFLGRISDSDKAGFYKSLSVYVAPQTGGESFGIVLAEAMAAGCPLVASDLQAFKDVSCNGACAELFPSSDPGKLAEAVCTVLKDDARRSSMVRAGMARSDDFDWATVTDDILSLYYGLAGTGQAAGTSVLR